ncbi:hypothetical protein DFH09DRAFT_1249304 [Mycena vulgaris]|nr:hypothetical protein DFH09DRAFT_1249304 [Mycena vulgaris]
MVVTGDFAQLPPMSGPSLYSGKVMLNFADTPKCRARNWLGRILWHQFTAVCLFPTALISMKYAVCTPVDISFLESHVAGFPPENPNLGSVNFHNVPIITVRNNTKQTLIDFCSIDRVSSRSVDRSKWKGCEQSEVKKMTKGLQCKLWESPLCTTSEFIPVMLHSKNVMEMCITTGQGAVVGWDESIVIGLPINILPLVRTVSHITVLLNNILLSVLREQIMALINFGMTDYTSQGKSSPWNVVGLVNCRTHMSYYVALSGFSALSPLMEKYVLNLNLTVHQAGSLLEQVKGVSAFENRI